MSKMFYSRLALSNLKKNSSVYIPYLLTCICSSAMFYIMHSISMNKGLRQMMGGDMVQMVLELGNVVIGLFSIIFLFYTNSFLMKRRKKELGLYNILGMEKRHIAKMILLETLYVAAVTLGIGLAGGILLSKLMFLVLLKLLQLTVPLQFSISVQSIGTTAVLFAAIFAVTLLFNLRQIHLAAPIELIRGTSQGEKEPKAKWIAALIGTAALAGGYFIAVMCESPVYAIMWFFPAVILVMIGTYLLFTTGSIAVLKLMKGNKGFYYKRKHFTVVSGMMYRMKQNAVGLANICILSTMVLVILSTTVSMYVGIEQQMDQRYPVDSTVVLQRNTPEMREKVEKALKSAAAKNGVQITDHQECEYFSIMVSANGTRLSADASEDYMAGTAAGLYIMTQDEYNRLEGKSVKLGEEDALVYLAERPYGEKTITVGDRTFQALELPYFALASGNMNRIISSSYYMVVKDRETALELTNNVEHTVEPMWQANLSLSGTKEAQIKFVGDVRQSGVGVQIIGKQETRVTFLTLTSGFLFLGLFLGTLFLIATVLIIYYKQISEGYEDKERFSIMKKVGMSGREVRESIRSQILMVFFLPLAAAMLHIVFAFPMFSQLLAAFSLDNTRLFLSCTLGTILVFAVFYVAVYGLTAKTYYKIVNYERG